MPGILERIPISRRLTLISLAYTLPIVVLLYFVVRGINQDVRFTELEKLGNVYQRPLATLLQHVPQHALATRLLWGGDAAGREAVSRSRAEIDRAFEAIRTIDELHAEDLQFTDQGLADRGRSQIAPAAVAREWEAIKQVDSGRDSERLHAGFLDRILLMIKHAGDTSNLILDPDLDSYYLMDATLLALPETQRRLAEAIDFFAELSRRPTVTAADRVELAVLAAEFKADLDRIATDVDTVKVEDPKFYGSYESLQAGLPPAFDRYVPPPDPCSRRWRRLGIRPRVRMRAMCSCSFSRPKPRETRASRCGATGSTGSTASLTSDWPISAVCGLGRCRWRGWPGWPRRFSCC